MATRTRRSKEEVLKSKLEKIDTEIKKLTEKINTLSEQKKIVDKELAILKDQKSKAERAAQLTAIADLMDSNGYTIEDIEKLMSMPKPAEQEVVSEATEEE
jgi:acetolactate synthase small subunit